MCITNCKEKRKVLINFIPNEDKSDYSRVAEVYEKSLTLRRFNQVLCIAKCPTGYEADATTGACKVTAPNFENLESQFEFPADKRDSIESSYQVTQDCSKNGIFCFKSKNFKTFFKFIYFL